MEKAVVFGRGKYLADKFDTVKCLYELVGIIDNGVLQAEFDTRYQLEVRNPRELRTFGDCHVICMSLQFAEMWKQLKELGVEDEKIEFGVNFMPHNTALDAFAFSDGQKISAVKDRIWYCDKDGEQFDFVELEELNGYLQKKFRNANRGIVEIANLPVKAYSRVFGCERGRAVDRYYIENFLEHNKDDIHGTVMEIASNDYIRKYGGNKVDKEIILHVEGEGKNAIKGNFETGEGLTEEMVNCLICTQTLQYIYDLRSAANNIVKILKEGGVALITVPGIKTLSPNDNKRWGDKWSFSETALRLLFEEAAGKENVSVQSFGNVKIATAYLYGLCCEDLQEEDFLYSDEQVPFIVTARVQKP